jgi:hypothetical protein
MDADDIAQPQRFERQVAFLAEHPDHGVLGRWSEDIDRQSRSIQAQSPGWDPPVIHEKFLAAIDSGEPLLGHTSVTFRADVVRAVGA